MRSKFLAAVILLSVIGLAQAHHSGSVYDWNRRQTLTGVLSKVEWIAPHVLIHLDVKDADGKLTNWIYEGMPPSWYRYNNLKRADVEKGLGQTVKIAGAPAHSGIPLALLFSIEFADGSTFEFQLSSFDPRVPPVPKSKPAASSK